MESEANDDHKHQSVGLRPNFVEKSVSLYFSLFESNDKPLWVTPLGFEGSFMIFFLEGRNVIGRNIEMERIFGRKQSIQSQYG